MLNFPRWKVWAISLTCLLGVLLAVPSFLPARAVASLPGWVDELRINLGLDLAGGSQLLLEAETDLVGRQRLEALEDTLRRELRRNRVQVSELSTAGGQLSFLVRDPAQFEQARILVRDTTQPTLFGATRDWDMDTQDNRIMVRPTQAGLDAAISQAMDIARGVIDRRINALGTLEPTILRQGRDRILVQVPGLQDPEALKALIGRTARLEFKMVDLTASQEQLQAGRAPAGSQVLPTQEGGRIAVYRRAIITGDMITDARQDYDQNDGTPNVVLSFDTTGSRRFARVTQENVGRPFAIILDNVVLSYPEIREPILGGQATISGGGFTVETANQLAISLRSGRLPVELSVIDERSVGPELGRDSIRQGTIASIVGAALVILFMLATYGRFGLFAIAALILNGVMILGLLGLAGSALTLPGIAGFVLTIGAAVDANIIINERIREELRKGRKVIDAIDHGWQEASTAILDANITNTIAGALMFYFGSGPVRGFAVVLMIGIVTSAFTAITVARMMVALWARRQRPKTLVL
ncbi:MAG: protein translocase subunit SecD [Sphingosinicella sp.]